MTCNSKGWDVIAYYDPGLYRICKVVPNVPISGEVHKLPPESLHATINSRVFIASGIAIVEPFEKNTVQ